MTKVKKQKEVLKKEDDSPRYQLLNCKLCGASFEEHTKANGGLVTRQLSDISCRLTDDLKIVMTDKCVAAVFVDFNKKRIFPEDKMIKVGDKIYIPSELHISRGSDDVAGGLATIKAITERKNVGVICQFVEVSELPGRSYNWTLYLKDIQEKLKNQYGERVAYPDPDIDTPWIEDGDIVDGKIYHGPEIW